MEQIIERAIAKSNADYTEVRLERSLRSQVLFQKDKLENLESSSEVGGIVRVFKDGGWGIAVVNDISQLPERVSNATRAARLVASHGSASVGLVKVPVVRETVRAELNNDFRSVPLKEKKELAENYNRILLSYDKRIVSTQARYTDLFREVTFANSEGTFLIQEVPDITLLLAAVASDGGKNIQQGFESIGEAAGFELVLGREGEARSAAKRAVDLLSAKSVKGGHYTTVLDPHLAGVFIHEAFGHLCEADFLFKNERLAKIMTPGTRFGNETLNVVDNGYMPGLRGSVPYDDEGVVRAKTHLITNGVLTSLLHSRETAERMGVSPTGNARAISYEYEPIVRMTNTYIESGDNTLAEMMSGIDRGIYAIKAYGGQTMFEQFTFSAAYAYMIENGEPGEMLRDVVLTGNLFETLRSIDMIGDDLQIHGGAGGCGKGGQFPLPVTDGSPHIRIQNVTIGGK
ncbi:MAG: TldD/PmbA family protein [Candidatus Bipolaricaulota bacterium]|nr:TldD/PmbA family protein [Candidatus Bipolaricaulota bacterium]